MCIEDILSNSVQEVSDGGVSELIGLQAQHQQIQAYTEIFWSISFF